MTSATRSVAADEGTDATAGSIRQANAPPSNGPVIDGLQPGPILPQRHGIEPARLDSSIAGVMVDERWAVFVRRAAMMPQPATRSNRSICDACDFALHLGGIVFP